MPCTCWGVVAHQFGQQDVAVDLIRQAIAVEGTHPAFHSNQGMALQALGRIDEAIAAYERAIALQSSLPQVHYNLGNAWKHKGRIDEAIACYRRALSLQADHVEAQNNLGLALHEAGRLDQAIACYECAVANQTRLCRSLQQPGHQPARPRASGASHRLLPAGAGVKGGLCPGPQQPGGWRCTRPARWRRRVACYQAALSLKNDYAEACNNMGNALKALGRLDDAVACYEKALELRADYAEAHNNLGLALKDKGQLDPAIASFRTALALQTGVGPHSQQFDLHAALSSGFHAPVAF